MTIPSIHLLALSIVASASFALTPEPTQAQARKSDQIAPSLMQRVQLINQSRMDRARGATTRPVANTEICVLDKETGAGLTILKVPAMASAILVKGMPHRFGLVSEELCADRQDNDCDGQIDEDCPSPENGMCGDGIVQENEECDDGNQIEGDGCSNDCFGGDVGLPFCGDGLMQQGEECDDGNRIDTDECRNNCTIPGASGPICGNGVVEGAEECDDGNQIEGDGCSNDCIGGDVGLPYCGDGLLQQGEECDDGNRIDTDECRNNCTIPGASGPICGNGVVEDDEICDDGNADDTDECTSECKGGPGGPGPRPEYWPAGYDCDECMQDQCAEQTQACLEDQDCWAPRSCVLETQCLSPHTASLSCLCGSLSIVECQNTTSFPGACAEVLIETMGTSDAQKLFSGWITPTTPGAKANNLFVCMTRKCKKQCRPLYQLPPRCGNGQVEANEECDDGNTLRGDGCSPECKIEGECGNGRLERALDESCDDGNRINGDGCSSDCQIEKPICGNGMLEKGEECDDGNLINGDGCPNDCKLSDPYCGNGLLEQFEECDDANNVAGDGCTPDCTIEEPVCGNGIVEEGEACDDGNDDFTDACAYCGRGPRCGNGLLEGPFEECDDGNLQTGDGCTPKCRLEDPVCGNGRVEEGEECDYADGVFGKLNCTADCRLKPIICGNGILEKGEQCDYLDFVSSDPNLRCTKECRLIAVDPPPANCSACMNEKCAAEIQACKSTQDCEQRNSCIVDSQCLTRNLGPLSCLCGEGRSVPECLEGTLEDLTGECAAQMLADLGGSTVQDAADRFTDPGTPTGVSNMRFICMVRKCRQSCAEHFRQEG